jgi:hypothetical protein
VFTVQVPAGQPVHVKIQGFDEDNFSDDEADLKTGDGNAIDFDVDPSTGQWVGDVTWPQDCSRPNLVLGGNNANVCWQASFDTHGRVYTVTYRVTDASGNATTRSATVNVPIDRRGDG